MNRSTSPEQYPEQAVSETEISHGIKRSVMEEMKESITGPRKKTGLPRKTKQNLGTLRRCSDKSRLENQKWDFRQNLKITKHRPRQINHLNRRDT